MIKVFARIAVMLAIGSSVLLAESEEKVVIEEPGKEQDPFGKLIPSLGKLIPYKKGVLVEAGADNFKSPPVMFAGFGSAFTKEHTMQGFESVLSVIGTREGFLFFGYKGNRFVMVEETREGKINPLPVPEEWQPEDLLAMKPEFLPELLESDHRCAAIRAERLWVYDGIWKSFPLPKAPKFYKEFTPEGFGEHRFLRGQMLFAGWDNGEWGGMLASIDMGKEEPGWKHLSGKKSGNSDGIPGNEPVTSIVEGKEGELWVSHGLDHMDLGPRGLNRRDKDGKWTTLVSGRFREDTGPVEFPGEEGCIYDVFPNAEGSVHALTMQGVFKISGEKVERELAFGDLGYPVSLATGAEGVIYISTNSSGLLAFKKVEGKWQGKRIGPAGNR